MLGDTRKKFFVKLVGQGPKNAVTLIKMVSCVSHEGVGQWWDTYGADRRRITT